jgi:tetratricopeptide (TPR) repeat protein
VADSLFHQSARLNPRYSVALVNIGNGYFDKQRYDSAAVYYQRAMRGEDPDSAVTGNQLAAALLRLGRQREAKEILQTIVKLPEKRPEVRGYQLMNLGKMLVAEGDTTGAREHWNRALEIAPEESPLRAQLKDLIASL